MQQSSNGHRARPLSRAIQAVLAVLLVVAVFSTAERLYLVNGDAYPSWLASGELGQVDHATIVRLRNTECSHDVIEIYHKRDSVVLRCGLAWYQPSTRTYIAESYNRP